MFSDVLRDLFHSGLGVIRVAAERFFGVPRVTALPTAGIDYRGTLTRLEGGAGVADRSVICEKNTADAYAWNDLGQAALDDRYVNVSGDTMTGDLSVTGTSPQITVSGSTAAALQLRDTGATDDSEIVQLIMDGGVAEVRLLNNNLTLKHRPLRFGSVGNIVFNEDGNAGADFRMETDTITNAFELDASANTVNLLDSAFRIRDNTDTSKLAAFEASGITTATTRTYTMPNADGTLGLFTQSESLTIATGVITTTLLTPIIFLTIDTEAAAASDTLDTLNGGITGQVAIVKSVASARDVIIGDATGNLRTSGAFTLDTSNDTITFIWTGTVWLEIGRANND